MEKGNHGLLMPGRSRTLNIKFPLAGVNRQAGYVQQAPYSTAMAVNVRGAGSQELRRRGGTRPGLARVCAQLFSGGITAIDHLEYIDSSGDVQHDIVIIAGGMVYYLRGNAVTTSEMAVMLENGQPLLTEDGQVITFTFSPEGGMDATATSAAVASFNAIGNRGAYNTAKWGGKLYIAGPDFMVYSPLTKTVSTVTASSGSIPYGCPLVAAYRDRIVLAGCDHFWFASRTGNPLDWSFADDQEDSGQPVSGQISYGKITALMPDEDRTLSLASCDSLCIIQGDLYGGQRVTVSQNVGVISQTAWCKTAEGGVVFLSRDGLYLWQLGSQEAPKRFSEEVMPIELLDVDPTKNSVVMSYDHRARGVSLFITPEAGRGMHWWIDLKNTAVWPMRTAEGLQPVAACGLSSGVLLACKDGYLRQFKAEAINDDGVPLESHIILGPFHISGNDSMDGMITELHSTLADNAGAVNWRVITGDSAESVIDEAVGRVETVLAGATPSGGAYAGQWNQNRNRIDRPRCRGPWAAIWLSSSSRWSFESLAIVVQSLGRMR